eukprot:scaffold1622_cov114-Skeletonema_menzelii.AAC.6
MKFAIASTTILYYFSPASASSSCQDLSASYPNDIPWVEYQGVYPPLDAPDGGCSTACVKGVSSDQARGCNHRPPSNKLVGFEYDCSRSTCKCLYEVGTLGNQYNQCFSGMNTSNKGSGEVDSTAPQQGETCYSLYIQSNNPPPSPTPPPPVGAGICAYAPDYDCYSDGHPPCCKESGGRDCPDYLTMCNNHAQGMTGFDYCTNTPDYQCYSTPNGRPSCCNEPGGSYMNCPQTQPKCDVQPTPPTPTPKSKGGTPPPKGGPPQTAFESFRRIDGVRSMKGQQKQTAQKPSMHATKKKFYLRSN